MAYPADFRSAQINPTIHVNFHLSWLRGGIVNSRAGGGGGGGGYGQKSNNSRQQINLIQSRSDGGNDCTLKWFINVHYLATWM